MSINYLIVNQRPADGAPRSPLEDVDRSSSGSEQGVSVAEQAALGYIVLRARAGQKSAIDAELGCELPIEPLTSTVAGDVCIRWVSPTEWLITSPADQTPTMEEKLRSNLGDEIAVVDNSGGYICIHLTGLMAELVIRKSTGYDVHLSTFPANKVVTTTFAQAQTILRSLGDAQFELIWRRSFADYMWRWLRDAAYEYGLEVKENSTDEGGG